jgi:hypothetical protein
MTVMVSIPIIRNGSELREGDPLVSFEDSLDPRPNFGSSNAPHASL